MVRRPWARVVRLATVRLQRSASGATSVGSSGWPTSGTNFFVTRPPRCVVVPPFARRAPSTSGASPREAQPGLGDDTPVDLAGTGIDPGHLAVTVGVLDHGQGLVPQPAAPLERRRAEDVEDLAGGPGERLG